MLSSIATNCDVTVLGEKLRKAQRRSSALLRRAESGAGGQRKQQHIRRCFRQFPSQWRQGRPCQSCFGANFACIFVAHTHRRHSQFQNSVDYAMRLQKYGVPFELHVFCNGPHGLSLATKETTCNDEKLASAFLCRCNWLPTGCLKRKASKSNTSKTKGSNTLLWFLYKHIQPCICAATR